MQHAEFPRGIKICGPVGRTASPAVRPQGIFLGNHYAKSGCRPKTIPRGLVMAAVGSLYPQRVRVLFPVLIAIVAVVGLSLAGDLLLVILPIRGGDVQWRFLVLGTFLGLAPQLAILLVVAMGVAIVGAMHGVIRVTAAMAFVLAIVVIVMMPFFLLDFLTMRRMVNEANKQRTDLTTLKTALFGGWIALMFLWVGIRGWQAGRRDEVAQRVQGEGLVVGRV
ncbi:MAG: hypothetical protein ACREK8_00670 [Gemmatimonadales bacterium]